jgi:hypothetical protein
VGKRSDVLLPLSGSVGLGPPIDLHRLSSPATLACRCDAGVASAGRSVNSSPEPRIIKVRYEGWKGMSSTHLLIALPLAAHLERRGLAIREGVGAGAGDASGSVVEDAAHGNRILVVKGAILLMRHVVVQLGAIQDTHDNSASAVSALVLREVVAAREPLTAVSALEGLVVSVERAVVTLEVFLATEATVAQGANEGLGRVHGERLLAAATAGGSCGRRRGLVGAGSNSVVVGT